jgi:hypothetical protein
MNKSSIHYLYPPQFLCKCTMPSAHRDFDWREYREKFVREIIEGTRDNEKSAYFAADLFVRAYRDALIHPVIEGRESYDLLYHDLIFKKNTAKTPLFKALGVHGIKTNTLVIEVADYDGDTMNAGDAVSHAYERKTPLLFFITRDDLPESRYADFAEKYQESGNLVLPLSMYDIADIIDLQEEHPYTFDELLLERLHKILPCK